MGVGELVDEPRLAHPGLAHDGDHLAVAGAGLVEHPAQVLDLGVAADEAREASERRGLQARPRRARPRQLEDLDGVGEPLHRDRAERLHLDVALGQRAASRAVSRIVPGSASCSIRAARCVVWPTAV